MFFQRITSPGLAHHSYVVADGSEAIVIDPRRDLDVYLDLAREHGLSIRWVLETHRHEDFVSGAAALERMARVTEVVHGPGLDWGYGAVAHDGDKLGVGRLVVRVIETPGHTDESVTFALSDTRSGQAPVVAFTGDALFVGDVGRVDLYGPGESQRLAEALFASLYDKIFSLGDGVVLAAAHGGGSVCGAAIADRDLSTLGFERAHNPGLRGGGRDAFIAAKLDERLVRPPYFERMEEWNRAGTAPSGPRPRPLAPMSPVALAEHIEAGMPVVDARMPQAFAGAHVPRTLNVWRDGLSGYLPWAVPSDAPVAFILPEHAPLDGIARTLYRLGYDDVVGYLRGGFEAWQNEGRPVQRTETVTTEELRDRLGRVLVLDVRTPGETRSGTIPGAQTIFVGDLRERLDELPRGVDIVTMCSVGHRGSLAASILEKHERRPVNYLGGYEAWRAAG